MLQLEAIAGVFRKDYRLFGNNVLDNRVYQQPVADGLQLVFPELPAYQVAFGGFNGSDAIYAQVQHCFHGCFLNRVGDAGVVGHFYGV